MIVNPIVIEKSSRNMSFAICKCKCKTRPPISCHPSPFLPPPPASSAGPQRSLHTQPSVPTLPVSQGNLWYPHHRNLVADIIITLVSPLACSRSSRCTTHQKSNRHRRHHPHPTVPIINSSHHSWKGGRRQTPACSPPAAAWAQIDCREAAQWYHTTAPPRNWARWRMPLTGTAQGYTAQTRIQSVGAEEEEGPAGCTGWGEVAHGRCIAPEGGEEVGGARSWRSPSTRAQYACWFGPGVVGEAGCVSEARLDS